MSRREPSPCVDVVTGRLCWAIYTPHQMSTEIEVIIAGTYDKIHTSWGYGTGGFARIVKQIETVPEEIYNRLFIGFENDPEVW